MTYQFQYHELEQDNLAKTEQLNSKTRDYNIQLELARASAERVIFARNDKTILYILYACVTTIIEYTLCFSHVCILFSWRFQGDELQQQLDQLTEHCKNTDRHLSEVTHSSCLQTDAALSVGEIW